MLFRYSLPSGLAVGLLISITPIAAADVGMTAAVPSAGGVSSSTINDAGLSSGSGTSVGAINPADQAGRIGGLPGLSTEQVPLRIGEQAGQLPQFGPSPLPSAGGQFNNQLPGQLSGTGPSQLPGQVVAPGAGAAQPAFPGQDFSGALNIPQAGSAPPVVGVPGNAPVAPGPSSVGGTPSR